MGSYSIWYSILLNSNNNNVADTPLALLNLALSLSVYLICSFLPNIERFLCVSIKCIYTRTYNVYIGIKCDPTKYNKHNGNCVDLMIHPNPVAVDFYSKMLILNIAYYKNWLFEREHTHTHEHMNTQTVSALSDKHAIYTNMPIPRYSLYIQNI